MTNHSNSPTLLPHAIIVEDEPNFASIYRYALEQAGYYVEVIRNGLDALDHLKKVSPRLLILDLNLPGLGGDEVLKEIQRMRAYKDTKIFLATANVRLAQELSDRVDLVLEKPIDYKVLAKLAMKHKPTRKEFFNDDTNQPFVSTGF